MGSSAEHVDAGVPESKRQNNSAERRRSPVIGASRARDRHVPVSGCQGCSGHGGNVKPAATLEKLMSRWLGMCLLSLPLMIVPVLAQDSARWHDPSKHSVRFVTVEEGVQLEVLDWGGTGRPVVLLAGRGFTAHVFDGFAEKLRLYREWRKRPQGVSVPESEWRNDFAENPDGSVGSRK